jgi:hypothetical protein
MDLQQRWVIAHQDASTEWHFFADRGRWTTNVHEAVHFHTLWGAEEARAHSAGGQGTVRNASDVYEFAASPAKQIEGAEAAA